MDLLGHGEAPSPHDPAAYARLAEHLEDLLPDEPVDAIGFSLGAQTLLRVAIARPERFRRLVLAGAPESLAMCRDRVLDALRAISDAHGSRGIVGIVSHQLAIASVTCTIAGSPLSKWRDFGLPNGTISVLSWNGSRFAIEAVRWLPDLPGPSPARV